MWPLAKATDQREKTEKTRIERVKNEVYKLNAKLLLRGKMPSLNYKRLEN